MWLDWVTTEGNSIKGETPRRGCSMVGMLQRQRRREECKLEKKIIQFSNWFLLQTTTLQSSVKLDCKVLDRGVLRMQGQCIWVSARSLAEKWRRLEKPAGSEGAFSTGRYMDISVDNGKEKSMLCIILYWSQTINCF